MHTRCLSKSQIAFINRNHRKPNVFCKATTDGSSNERMLQDAIIKFKEAVQNAKEKRKEVREARIASLKSIHDAFKAIAEDEIKYVKNLTSDCVKSDDAFVSEQQASNTTDKNDGDSVFVDKL